MTFARGLLNDMLYVGGMTEGSMVSPSLGSFDGFVITFPVDALK